MGLKKIHPCQASASELTLRKFQYDRYVQKKSNVLQSYQGDFTFFATSVLSRKLQ